MSYSNREIENQLTFITKLQKPSDVDNNNKGIEKQPTFITNLEKSSNV
jgi:hypothetical protein